MQHGVHVRYYCAPYGALPVTICPACFPPENGKLRYTQFFPARFVAPQDMFCAADAIKRDGVSHAFHHHVVAAPAGEKEGTFYDVWACVDSWQDRDRLMRIEEAARSEQLCGDLGFRCAYCAPPQPRFGGRQTDPTMGRLVRELPTVELAGHAPH